MDENIANVGEVIVLNRMFNGGYLEDNIGHEVINLFKSDGNDGKYYLYLNALGSFDKKWTGLISTMLMVRTIPGAKMIEVIGLAKELRDVYDPEYANNSKEMAKQQQEYIRTHGIKYNGKELNAIFSDNSFQQDICVTFVADSVVKPSKPIFIKFDDGTPIHENIITDNNTILVYLEGLNAAKASLKQYIPNSGDSKKAYETLMTIINNKDLWSDEFKTVKDSIGDMQKRTTDTMFDICGIAYSELAYSNAIAHFFKKYKHLFSGFIETLAPAVNNSKWDGKFPIEDTFIVKRELYNIDLLFTNGKTSIVIENKIKSGINGLDKYDPNKSQLEKYYKLLAKHQRIQGENEKEKNDVKELRRQFPNPVFFVLTPDYNNVDIEKYTCGEHYTKIHYSQLYKYLIDTKEYKDNEDHKFHDFVDGLERHAQQYNNELYDVTLQRFMDMIKNIK